MGGFGASEAETTREETETKSEDEEMVRPPHRRAREWTVVGELVGQRIHVSCL